MNSRQTAAVFGCAPNPHWQATDASLVPLVRMSSTVFAGGDREPADLLKEIDHGYYLVGHRTPSIAESRENFRISARKIYEIHRGEVGRLYRDGGIMADSRDFLMHVDGVGRDFRLYPIPNCGKGQPMQTRKLGNGGPTLRRSRHRDRRSLAAWTSLGRSGGAGSPRRPAGVRAVEVFSRPSTARSSPA